MQFDLKNKMQRDRFTWRIFTTFLILFPISDGFRLATHFPPGSFNLAILIAFCIGIIIMGFTRGLHNRKILIKPIEWILIIFVAFTILSTLHSINISLSIFGIPGEYGGLLPQICYAILFLWIIRFIQPHEYTKLLHTIVLASILPTIYGILQHIQHMPTIPYVSRSLSFFCNADFFGTYMALIFILTLTLYITLPRWHSIGYLILLALQFIALIFSYTRSAWLGCIIGVACLLITALMHQVQLRKRLMLLLCVLFASLLLLNHQSHNQVISRASSIATNAKQVITNHHINYAGSSRWYIWRESLPLIANNILLGTGPDTFQQAFHPPKSGAMKYLGGQSIANANNAYLQIAVTSGLPAFILLMIFYAMILYKGLQSVRRLRSSDNHYLITMGLLSTVICYVIQAVFNMDVVMVAPLFWIVLGALYKSITNQAR